MSRLIDADALLEHVWRDRLDSRERIAELVKFMPTIKPERKKGQWEGTLLVKNSGRVKCSECYAIYDWDTQAQYFKYCPNCGADMRGAERRKDG